MGTRKLPQARNAPVKKTAAASKTAAMKETIVEQMAPKKVVARKKQATNKTSTLNDTIGEPEPKPRIADPNAFMMQRKADLAKKEKLKEVTVPELMGEVEPLIGKSFGKLFPRNLVQVIPASWFQRDRSVKDWTKACHLKLRDLVKKSGGNAEVVAALVQACVEFRNRFHGTPLQVQYADLMQAYSLMSVHIRDGGDAPTDDLSAFWGSEDPKYGEDLCDRARYIYREANRPSMTGLANGLDKAKIRSGNTTNTAAETKEEGKKTHGGATTNTTAEGKEEEKPAKAKNKRPPKKIHRTGWEGIKARVKPRAKGTLR